jgi:two-component system, OmpR family, response regulator RegX3
VRTAGPIGGSVSRTTAGTTSAGTTTAAIAGTAGTAATTDSPNEREAAPRPPLGAASSSSHFREMSRPKRTILLVEDEASIRDPLADVLRSEGFDTLVAGSVAEALEQARRDPDLVLLDLMLPDGSGFDVCRELRQHSQVPIIMLTARGEEADRVVGLELGADDYVVKPFSGREVVARIRAVLRRAATPEPADERPLEVGPVRLEPARREVTLEGSPLELSRKEYELLHLLMRNAGSVVTRERLIDEVWDPNWFGSTKTLDVHVSGIRRKLGDDPAKPRFVHTVRGVGFRFSAPDEVE